MFSPSSPSLRFSRRQLLQVGSGGLFGLHLPQLLFAQHNGRRASGAQAKSCIFIVLSGGLSHIDTLDPKPHAPHEVRGPYESVSTSVPGLQVTGMLPQLAKQARRYMLLRSLSHRDAVHVTAAHTMLSGQPDGRRRNNSPFMGSLISMLRPAAANMPSG